MGEMTTRRSETEEVKLVVDTFTNVRGTKLYARYWQPSGKNSSKDSQTTL